jgi:DNA-binding protein HU-beta
MQAFIQHLAGRLDISTTEARTLLEGVLDGITETLVNDSIVKLADFGTFEVTKRKPRMGRNPRTGERLNIPERRAVTFKAARSLLGRIDQMLGTSGQGS